MDRILNQLILNQALGAPYCDLTFPPLTSFDAMERYIGNMFVSLISYHVNIIKNKKDILWMEF